MSDTPITDAFVLKLERQLGDGPPNISEAAIDVAVRIRILSFAREIERALAGAKREAANAYKGYQACNDDLIKCDAEVMRWFKAASPYATPGSLEAALRRFHHWEGEMVRLLGIDPKDAGSLPDDVRSRKTDAGHPHRE